MLEADKARAHSTSLAQGHTPPLHRQRPPETRHILPILLVLLIVLILLHIIAITHTAYPTITMKNCLDLLRYTDYRKIFTTATQTVGDVQLLDQSDESELAVFVPVLHQDPPHLMDIYVYGCQLQKQHPKLIQLFKQQGLLQDTAVITPAHTLSISTPNPTSTNISTTVAPLQQTLQQDINREYGWHNGTFEQITFPGLYPAISRIEAEALQDQEDQQQNMLWTDPLKTTMLMAKELFHWSSTNMTVSLQDQSATIAHVLLIQHTPIFKVAVTLQRLIEPGANGLWFVTRAQTAGITLNQAQSQTLIASPATIQGTMIAAPGTTTITLFDHTLTTLPLLSKPAVTLQSNGTFKASFFFTNNIADQPGLLLIEHPASTSSSATGQLLLSSALLN
jgi:hypothetical protein